jgi:hypothetical protein
MDYTSLRQQSNRDRPRNGAAHFSHYAKNKGRINMKKAVIVVGSHFVGKSKTINKHLKPKLGIGEREHKFIRNSQNGYILSQSFEEANRDVDYVINNYSGYELLVLSARPAHENPSLLADARTKLSHAGFRVSEVFINSNDNNDSKANEILRHLDN